VRVRPHIDADHLSHRHLLVVFDPRGISLTSASRQLMLDRRSLPLDPNRR
jgi:hypothetical protein